MVDFNKLFHKSWALAFVQGGMDAIFSDTPFKVQIVKNPYKDRCYADPFILDVKDDSIIVLAEEIRFSNPVGRIAKLVIDRKKNAIVEAHILLELPTHLSFPNYYRQDGVIYIYPENCLGGDLKCYVYDQENEKLVSPKVICRKAVWDSTITDALGCKQLWGGFLNDHCIDVFDWNESSKEFEFSFTIESPEKNYRLAGQIFNYQGQYYCPTQDCRTRYGAGVFLNRISPKGNLTELIPVKYITSPVPAWQEGLHTINQYQDLVIIDLKGWQSQLGRFLYIIGHSIKLALGLEGRRARNERKAHEDYERAKRDRDSAVS